MYLYLKKENTKSRILRASLFLFLTLPFLNTIMLTDNNWHEWWCRLDSTQQRVVQRIYIPACIDISSYKKADLFIDMIGSKEKDYDFIIKVNGREIKRYHKGLKAEREKFQKRFFGFYEYFFFRSYKLSPEDLRQWYRVPIDIKTLASRNPIVIECLVEKSPKERGCVLIFGDYLTKDSIKENIFEGPCIPSTNQDTSLYKIMPYVGDCRFIKRQKLKSKATKSLFCFKNRCQNKDLSFCFGIQNGRYRIYIGIKKDKRKIFL